MYISCYSYIYRHFSKSLFCWSSISKWSHGWIIGKLETLKPHKDLVWITSRYHNVIGTKYNSPPATRLHRG